MAGIGSLALCFSPITYFIRQMGAEWLGAILLLVGPIATGVFAANLVGRSTLRGIQARLLTSLESEDEELMSKSLGRTPELESRENLLSHYPTTPCASCGATVYTTAKVCVSCMKPLTRGAADRDSRQ